MISVYKTYGLCGTLLSEEDQRDSDTGAIHLLDLINQGFDRDTCLKCYPKTAIFEPCLNMN